MADPTGAGQGKEIPDSTKSAFRLLNTSPDHRHGDANLRPLRNGYVGVIVVDDSREPRELREIQRHAIDQDPGPRQGHASRNGLGGDDLHEDFVGQLRGAHT